MEVGEETMTCESEKDPMEKTFRRMFGILVVLIIVLILGLLLPEALISWKKAITYRGPTEPHEVILHQDKR